MTLSGVIEFVLFSPWYSLRPRLCFIFTKLFQFYTNLCFVGVNLLLLAMFYLCPKVRKKCQAMLR